MLLVISNQNGKGQHYNWGSNSISSSSDPNIQINHQHSFTHQQYDEQHQFSRVPYESQYEQHRQYLRQQLQYQQQQEEQNDVNQGQYERHEFFHENNDGIHEHGQHHYGSHEQPQQTACEDFHYTPQDGSALPAAFSSSFSIFQGQLGPEERMKQLDMVDHNHRIGAYTVEERRVLIEKFRSKKRRRVYRKQVKYDCRKKLADTRPRIKGRFVSKTEGGDKDDKGDKINTQSDDKDDKDGGCCDQLSFIDDLLFGADSALDNP